MKKSFLAVLTILGTVIGSGFISGKEIMVFFSRFGAFSYVSIFIAFWLFFFLFKFILNNGQTALERIKKSKLSFLINIILCLIFSAAMFGGIGNLLKFKQNYINFIIFALILAVCTLIFIFGICGLNKANVILVPFMVIVLLVLLAGKINFKINWQSSYYFSPIVYGILYCVLNTANGSVILAELGSDLTKRQKAQVAFLSALVLSGILFVANTVLLSSPELLDSAMPLVSLFDSSARFLMSILIFIGCLTTLLTLIVTMSSSMKGMCKNKFLLYFISVILPLGLSLFGFNFIVEYLYPLASVLGIYLLLDLFFVPFFKRAYNKVHAAGKKAQYDDAGHNNVKF